MYHFVSGFFDIEHTDISVLQSRELTTEHQRLAEIIEMIHTASLIHDDVIDDSGMRRGMYNVFFRNKSAVLSIENRSSIMLFSIFILDLLETFV